MVYRKVTKKKATATRIRRENCYAYTFLCILFCVISMNSLIAQAKQIKLQQFGVIVAHLSSWLCNDPFLSNLEIV